MPDIKSRHRSRRARVRASRCSRRQRWRRRRGRACRIHENGNPGVCARRRQGEVHPCCRRRCRCRRPGARHHRDLIPNSRCPFWSRVAPASRARQNSFHETGISPVRGLGQLETATAAVSRPLPCRLPRRDRRRGRKLHSRAFQGRPRSFRHQPRHPRWSRLRGRRHPGALHHPVDVETVRVRAGAGQPRRLAGGKRRSASSRPAIPSIRSG